MSTIDIYTDASVYNGHKYKKHFIGYAGVIMNYEGEKFVLDGFIHKRTVKEYFNLGCKAGAINIMHGEMIAILKSLWSFRKGDKNIRIFSDSIPAIDFLLKRVKGWKNSKYQNLTNLFDKLVSRIESNGGSVELFWVKGHEGCVGNNLADYHAKIYQDIAPLLSKRQRGRVKGGVCDSTISDWLFTSDKLTKYLVWEKEVNEFNNYRERERENDKNLLTFLSIIKSLRKNVHFL